MPRNYDYDNIDRSDGIDGGTGPFDGTINFIGTNSLLDRPIVVLAIFNHEKSLGVFPVLLGREPKVTLLTFGPKITGFLSHMDQLKVYGTISFDQASSVTSLNPSFFANCSRVLNFDFPPLLTQIPETCCLNCVSLASVNIPGPVTKLGDSAFGDCIVLENVTFNGSNLQTLMSGTF
jgi:hypothetical protein